MSEEAVQWRRRKGQLSDIGEERMLVWNTVST